jgi:Phospholipase_D-nuclease N-terminal
MLWYAPLSGLIYPLGLLFGQISLAELSALLFGLRLGFLVLIGLSVLLSVALFAFWIWMLVDGAQSTTAPSSHQRIAWILILVFTHWLGALLYFFLVRRPRLATTRISAFTTA